MSERHEPACPMMRAATGLQHNLGRLELAEEGFDLAPSELAAQHRAVLLVDTVQREHVLGRVDRNALKLHEDGPSLEHDSPTLARDAVGPSTPTTGISFDPFRAGMPAGMPLISRAAAPPTPRAYQSAQAPSGIIQRFLMISRRPRGDGLSPASSPCLSRGSGPHMCPRAQAACRDWSPRRARGRRGAVATASCCSLSRRAWGQAPG